MAIKASGSRGRYGSAKNARGGNVRTSSIPYRKMRKTGNRDLYGMLGQRLSIGDQLGTGSGTGDNEFGPGGPGGYADQDLGLPDISSSERAARCAGGQIQFCY